MENKKKGYMKRSIISLILALMLIVSIPSGTAYAAELPKISYSTIDTVGADNSQLISDQGQILKSYSFGGVTYNVTRDDELAWQVFDLLNKERAKYGLPGFTMDKQLMDTAMGRAAEITVKFDHTRPNGSSCFSVYPMAGSANGWNGQFACGENIAAGQTSPAEVMNDWMNSSGHRKNILNANYKSVGIGCVRMNGGYYFYWTQSFGDRVIEEADKGGYISDGPRLFTGI